MGVMMEIIIQLVSPNSHSSKGHPQSLQASQFFVLAERTVGTFVKEGFQ